MRVRVKSAVVRVELESCVQVRVPERTASSVCVCVCVCKCGRD